MDTHASTQSLLPLQEPPTDGRTLLNGSVWFVDSDGYRVVFRWHEPLYRVVLTDEVHLRLVAVSLRQSQLATQEEICRAFGHDVSTQARWERQYRKHGIDGLVPKKCTGRPQELDKSQEGFVRRWFRAGVSNRQMAKRMGVGESTIRRTLQRMGLVREEAPLPSLLPPVEDAIPAAAIAGREMPPATAMIEEAAVVVEEAAVAPAVACPPTGTALVARKTTLEEEAELALSFTLDRDPHDRSGDRAMARLGRGGCGAVVRRCRVSAACRGAVDSAAVGAPRPGRDVRRGVPLDRAGVLRPADDRGGAVSRGPVANQASGALEESRPEDLGAILGLDLGPEVKTVRRSLGVWRRWGGGSS